MMLLHALAVNRRYLPPSFPEAFTFLSPLKQKQHMCNSHRRFPFKPEGENKNLFSKRKLASCFGHLVLSEGEVCDTNLLTLSEVTPCLKHSGPGRKKKGNQTLYDLWGQDRLTSQDPPMAVFTRTPQWLANGLWNDLPMAVLGIFASHWGGSWQTLVHFSDLVGEPKTRRQK